MSTRAGLIAKIAIVSGPHGQTNNVKASRF
jgi:hypothetical protein